MKRRAVILAAGEFPKKPYPLYLLDSADVIVCCDGAAATFRRHFGDARLPDAVIGDLDSISPSIRRHYADRIVQIEEQDDNDLTKALGYLTEHETGLEEITILGATGKREDHTIGNISLLADFAQKIPDIEMVTDHGVFTVALRSGTFPSTPGEQISLFAVDPDTRVSSSGLKYPLNDLPLERWRQATLNEAIADRFTLTFTGDRRLLIYRASRP